jgi:tetratricopeptide (TPR) repeat protein
MLVLRAPARRRRKMKMRILKYALITAAVVAFATPGLAGIQARMQGQIIDTQGKPIPHASVTLKGVDVTTFEKVLKVDKKGFFKALIIDATNRYKLVIEADGYQSQERPLKVPAGSTNNFFKYELVSIAEAQAEGERNVMEQPGYKQVREAKELYLAGDKAAARDKLEEGLAEVPGFLPALGLLAELHYEMGDSQAALEAAQSCLEEDDESVKCLAVAANAASNLGDETLKAEYMARYEEVNPDDPSVLYNEAAGYLNKLDDDSARPLLEKCVDVGPDFPPCHFEYGMLLLRTGDMEGAKGHLEKYLELVPDGRDAETARETIKYL